MSKSLIGLALLALGMAGTLPLLAQEPMPLEPSALAEPLWSSASSPSPSLPPAPQLQGSPTHPGSLAASSGAFDEPGCDFTPHWQVGLDYRMLWVRGADMPVVLSTGDLLDAVPGAVGQPGTVPLFGGKGFNQGDISALGLHSILWLADPQILGIEGQFFVAEQRTRIYDSVTSGNANDLFLARPFFNAPFGREDADPRIVAGAMAGESSTTYLTRLLGAETNVVFNANNHQTSANLYLLAGLRYLQIDEKFATFDDLFDTPTGSAGNVSTFRDNFTTYNRIYAAQLGARLNAQFEQFGFSVFTKLGFGRNNEELNISGSTQITDLDAATTVIDNDQGLYAQPTNIGTYRKRTYVFIPEIGFNVNWDYNDHIRFACGYDFLQINRILRPGDHIDRNINVQPVGAPFVFDPQVPQVQLQQANYWIQSVNFGVEFTF